MQNKMTMRWKRLTVMAVLAANLLLFGCGSGAGVSHPKGYTSIGGKAEYIYRNEKLIGLDGTKTDFSSYDLKPGMSCDISYSPDHSLAVVTQGGKILGVAKNGKFQRVSVETPADCYFNSRDMKISVYGDSVLYAAISEPDSGNGLLTTEIYLYDVAQNKNHKIGRYEGISSWGGNLSPDGKTLIYYTVEKTGSGRVSAYYRSDNGQPGVSIAAPVPDGASIYGMTDNGELCYRTKAYELYLGERMIGTLSEVSPWIRTNEAWTEFLFDTGEGVCYYDGNTASVLNGVFMRGGGVLPPENVMVYASSGGTTYGVETLSDKVIGLNQGGVYYYLDAKKGWVPYPEFSDAEISMDGRRLLGIGNGTIYVFDDIQKCDQYKTYDISSSDLTKVISLKCMDNKVMSGDLSEMYCVVETSLTGKLLYNAAGVNMPKDGLYSVNIKNGKMTCLSTSEEISVCYSDRYGAFFYQSGSTVYSTNGGKGAEVASGVSSLVKYGEEIVLVFKNGDVAVVNGKKSIKYIEKAEK